MKEKFFSSVSYFLAPVLYRVLPQRYLRTLKDKSIVWGFVPQKSSLTEKIMMRLMRPYFLKQFYSQSESQLRQANREQYWGGTAGKVWHEEIRKKYSSPEAFENEFVKRRETMTGLLEQFILEFPGKFPIFCEIGTGNGLYIHYLYEKFTSSFEHWVGIDLNSDQISTNKKIYRNTPIEFISAEVGNWIEENVKSGTLFMAVGTLECFTQNELDEFFNQIKSTYTNAAIALIEPTDSDFTEQTESTPRGLYMFNHNYPYLLERAGFKIFRSLSNPAEPDNPENKKKLHSIIAYL
jgi:hypothetical protein